MADMDLRDLHGRHEPDPEFRRALRDRITTIVERPQPWTTDADIDPLHEKDIIMLTDTRPETDAPKAPRRWWPAVAATALLAVGVTAALVGTTGDDSSIATGTAVVFEDGFEDDSGGWQRDDAVRVEDGQQVWTLPAGQRLHLRPLALDDRLVDMEVSAVPVSADPETAIGVHCRKGPQNEDFYYYFRLGPDGASIGVLPEDRSATGRVLASAPDFERPTGSFTLTARCVDAAQQARLTLLVDGEPVLDATDDEPLPAGYGAIEVQAGGLGAEPSEVRWARFTVKALD